MPGSMKREIMAGIRKEIIFYIGLGAAVLSFLVFAGKPGYYEYPDSWQYITIKGAEGVMPLYQLFIHLHRLVLGEKGFLYGVVVTQTLLTALCLFLFVFWVCRRFHPGFWVTGLGTLALLVPFTLDFPETLVNHSILTEALTYPLFYLFVIAFVQSVIGGRARWLLGTFGTALLLALIRTQMQICFGFAALALMYGIVAKAAKKSKGVLLLGCTAAVPAGILALLLSEAVLLQANGRLQTVAAREAAKLAGSAQAGTAALGETTVPWKCPDGGRAAGPGNGILAAAAVPAQADSSNVTGQFDSVLLCRTLYEMEEEDSALFADPEIQKLFRKFYEAAETSKARYAYAGKGLWMWKDIMNGTAQGAYTSTEGWKAYREENPQSALLQNQTQANRTVAFALLKKHWPRMLYHTLWMLPQGFVSTVFFQVEKIYGICHLYTLLAYGAAIGLLLTGSRFRLFSPERGKFMLCALALNAGMVVVISVVFFGMQRYVIYGFGVFYMALLLLAEQCGRVLWTKIKSRF